MRFQGIPLPGLMEEGRPAPLAGLRLYQRLCLSEDFRMASPFISSQVLNISQYARGTCMLAEVFVFIQVLTRLLGRGLLTLVVILLLASAELGVLLTNLRKNLLNL